jgi:predicted amidohydrolase
MKLALAQMLVLPDRLDENLRRAERLIRDASRKGAEVVLLPETMDLGWCAPADRENSGPVKTGPSCRRLRSAAVKYRMHVCSGFTERGPDGVFNSAVLIDPKGRILLHHRKINELSIGRAFYGPGDRLGVAETPWGRIGLMICADANASGYAISRSLCMMGARIILSPCAWAVPPGYDNVKEPYGKLWVDAYGAIGREFGTTVAGCSNVGPIGHGEWKGWDCIGNSIAVGPDGRELLRGPFGPVSESLLFLEIP